MHHTSTYDSPIGEILIAADDEKLIGLWFQNQRYFAYCLDEKNEPKETSVIKETKKWLDIYFSGKKPDFEPPLRMTGTNFQIEVWNILRKIPYGTTVTYKSIAKRITRRRVIYEMSAQAVGNAVGRNNISLIVPCHRVVGSDGSLSGYAGGIDKKIFLLKLEGAYSDRFYIPKHSTAP